MTPVRAPGAVAHGDLESLVAERVGSAREARWLVQHVDGDSARALVLADRRAAGEPLQYVLGRWPFRSLELAVDTRVLIPRPETEQVVEVALSELASLQLSSEGFDDEDPVICVDLGTGSGAIALSLATEGRTHAPGLQVWATDASRDALEVAGANLEELARRDPDGARRVRLREGSWFEALPAEVAGQVSLVVANPPYVAETEFSLLDPTVRLWEPRSALVAPDGRGVGGLGDIETIVAGALPWMKPGGVLVVEIDPAQAEATLATARQAGWDRAETRRDLAGRIRMVVARR